MKTARLAAFELIYQVFSKQAYSNLSLDAAYKEVLPSDKRFMSALALGVIERRLTLEYLVSRFLKSKTKPKVLVLLYMGAYQLYFMDKVPASAAVNETVELAKQVGCGYYARLINAVLRQVDSHRIDLNAIDDISIRFSVPEQLIRMWEKHYGREQTLSVLESLNLTPPLFAVPNKLYVTPEELCYELQCENIECVAQGECVRLLSAADLTDCKAFNNGLFHIEDLSSYNAAMALSAEPGDTVLDVCAAPGGKAFTLAQCMNNSGTLYAYDLYAHRVALINNGAKRLGLNNVVTAVNDASQKNDTIPQADKILCDVPCSGFGIIRRKPEIRYKPLDSISNLPQLQYKILSVSASYLKPGGRILYSTCTLNKKENEKVIERFLKEQQLFCLIEEKTVFPSPNGGDGFYYALLERKI